MSKPMTPPTSLQRHAASRSFEKKVTLALKAQDAVLETIQTRLGASVLNGGFDSLMSKVEKIESIQLELGNLQGKMGEQVASIHTAIYDPDNGLYAKVRDAIKWITTANWIVKGTLGLFAASGVAAFGKIAYDVISGHLHYAP